MSASTVIRTTRVWLKIKQEGQTAGFGPCFHLPGFQFGTGFLSHSHSEDNTIALIICSITIVALIQDDYLGLQIGDLHGHGSKRETARNWAVGFSPCLTELHFGWVNYGDLARPHPKWWFMWGIAPQAPYFRLVKYHNSPIFWGYPILTTTAACNMSPFFPAAGRRRFPSRRARRRTTSLRTRLRQMRTRSRRPRTSFGRPLGNQNESRNENQNQFHGTRLQAERLARRFCSLSERMDRIFGL